ncbi:HPr family phosphocarrier protein [Tepidimicrobium xylanilyticum]|uniref:Phosphocarrier protein HPr n=1 Tax=Tepidimicrobium xylanilyticum TaxID=1123352 RepID=A0A1H2UUP3_9FIRM|nr:HPr family phosphocarrier protein [Tepidimicrobium xylanilyticum]GMG96804.1 HPr-like protein Crh [Tepidimicrobium xylanilyticum]SDW59822.1 phosphocarrier protein [Tepidimicrobium xylanilyticum]
MIRKNVVLNNEIGLHARPAALFVQTASKFSSNVYIELDGKKVNGKSIIGVMSLGAFHGEEITLIVNGEDEKEAMEELSRLIEHGLKDL